MNKLAATTLEGGLHVWDCSQLDSSGRLAEVRARVGSSTVWTGMDYSLIIIIKLFPTVDRYHGFFTVIGLYFPKKSSPRSRLGLLFLISQNHGPQSRGQK